MYTHKELVDSTLLAQAVFSFCFFLSAFAVAANDYAGFVAVVTAFVYSIFTGVTYYGISYRPNQTFYGATLGASIILIFLSFESAMFWGLYGSCSTYEEAISSTTDSPSSYPSSYPSSSPSSNPSASPSLSSTPTQSPTSARRLSSFFLSSSSLSSSSLSSSSFRQEITSQSRISPLWESQLLGQNRRLYGVECSYTSGMKSCCAFSVFMMLTYLFLTVLLIRFKNEILVSATFDDQYAPVATDYPSSPYPISSNPYEEQDSPLKSDDVQYVSAVPDSLG
jgi:hypothetical protein